MDDTTALIVIDLSLFFPQTTIQNGATHQQQTNSCSCISVTLLTRYFPTHIHTYVIYTVS